VPIPAIRCKFLIGNLFSNDPAGAYFARSAASRKTIDSHIAKLSSTIWGKEIKRWNDLKRKKSLNF
jgi:hypothetical protein